MPPIGQANIKDHEKEDFCFKLLSVAKCRIKLLYFMVIWMGMLGAVVMR